MVPILEKCCNYGHLVVPIAENGYNNGHGYNNGLYFRKRLDIWSQFHIMVSIYSRKKVAIMVPIPEKGCNTGLYSRKRLQ